MVVIATNYVIKLNITKNYPYIIMNTFYQFETNFEKISCLSPDQSMLFIEIQFGIMIFDFS